MKKYISILSAFAVALVMGACTSDSDDASFADGSSSVEANTSGFTEQTIEEGETTRSTLTYTSGVLGLTYAWSKGDQLAVYKYSSKESLNKAAFTISSSYTGGMAGYTFENESFALQEGGMYYAFFPEASLPSDPSVATLDYTGQRQTINWNSSNPAECTAQLGPKDYQVSMAQASNNTATFHFKHLGAILHIKMKIPEAGSFNQMDVTRTDGYDYKMTRTINLTDNYQNVVANYNPKFPKLSTTSGDHISIQLGAEDGSGIHVDANGILHAFIMIPATSEVDGVSMLAVLKNADSNGKNYYITFDGASYVGGTMYTIGKVAHAESSITENIIVHKDWQNGSATSVTRATTTGDPGTTETLDAPKYLTIYTCGDGKVIDVWHSATPTGWTATTDGWKYTRELTKNQMPTNNIHVYAVASDQDIYDSSIKEGTAESSVQALTYTVSDPTNTAGQYTLANTYTVPTSTIDAGTNAMVDLTKTDIASIDANLYHVAAKVDVNWDCPSYKVGEIKVCNLINTGYLFKPLDNNAITWSYNYTLRSLVGNYQIPVEEQYYGRAYFYEFQQKDANQYSESYGKFPLVLYVGGDRTINNQTYYLTPGANYTSWFRVNISNK